MKYINYKKGTCVHCTLASTSGQNNNTNNNNNNNKIKIIIGTCTQVTAHKFSTNSSILHKFKVESANITGKEGANGHC